MATDLADFISIVKTEINRGDDYDAAIPTYVRMGARFIERNWNFRYMEASQDFTTNPLDANPTRFTLPANYKRSRLLRRVAADGQFVLINKVEVADITATVVGLPEGFWIDGTSYLRLDNIPGEIFTMNFFYHAYTLPWPTNTTEAPWLVVHAEQLLLAATMISIAPMMRTPELKDIYADVMAVQMKQLINETSDEETGGSSSQSDYRG